MPQQVRKDIGQALYAAPPKPDMDLIKRRFAEAERQHRQRMN